LVLAVLFSSHTVPAGVAAADTIGEKRAEAERITRQLEQQSRRVSILAEDYDEARVRIGELEKELSAARAKVAATDARAGEVRGRLKGQAVEAYVQGGAAPTLALLASADASQDLAVRSQYVRTVTSGAVDVLDELREVRQDLDAQRERLDAARTEADAAAALAEARRREAAQAEAAQQRTLRQVQGELSALVEAEAKRRAEEEARRVQAELAARRARQEAVAREAAKRASTTTAPRASAPVVTVRPPTTAAGGTGSTGGSAGSSGSAGAPAAGAEAAIAEARRQLGKPYQYGAGGPDSFDCSGLTSWAWRAGGVTLPHSSRAQWSATSRVTIDELQPGDLVFYGSPIHHVGLFIGGGQMIEAPETGKYVQYASIFRRDFVGAGRVN
jgi:cell wall-associated NlpC family hydrolase